MKLNIKDESNNNRKKRSADRIALSELSFKSGAAKKEPVFVVVAEAVDNTTGMVIHKMNVDKTNTMIDIKIVPNYDYVDIELYIKYKARPDITQFDFKVIMDKVIENGRSTRHTQVQHADLANGQLGDYFIGVKFPDRGIII